MSRTFNITSWVIKCTLSVFVFLAVAGISRLDAQTNVNALIQGAVTDSSGGVLAGVTIQVKNIGTGLTRSVVTDSQGRYTATDLQIGDYEVQAAISGFGTAIRKGITLSVGSQLMVDFTLQVGSTQQTVTVEAEVPQVETTSAAVSNLVDQTQMRALPLNGRNVEQMILLAPGVQLVTIEASNSFFGRQTNYSVAGGRAEGQAFLLDNQDMQNFYGHGIGASGIGTSLGVEGIAEFQTLTNTYSAQFGGNGAAINSVSKGGTNLFHGSAYEFLRSSALDARQFIDPAQIPGFRRNQFGGSVGGPVKKDKAFFFANYEGLRQLFGETKKANIPDANHRTSTASDPNVAAAVNNTLSLFPATTVVDAVTGIVKIPVVANQIAHENYVLGRFDYTFSEKDSLFVRYVSDRGDFLEPFPNGTTSLAYWSEQTINRNQFGTIEERHIFSPALINTARFSYARPITSGVTLTHAPNNATNFYPGTGRQDAQVTITGLTSLGPNNTTPFTFVQNKFTGADDVVWTKGGHTITFGFSVLRNQTNTFDQFQIGGVWSFGGLAQFLAGTATSFVGTLPDNLAAGGVQIYNRDTRATELTPYFNDEWKVLPKLTLNLGLRYDFVTNPYEIHNNSYNLTNPPNAAAAGVTNLLGIPQISHIFTAGNPSRFNFDPRIGVAYDPFGDHKTSIRAGLGMFHDVIQGRSYFPGIWDTPPTSFGQQSNPNYGTAFAGTTVLRINPGTDSRINTSPYMIQWNLNVQHDFAGNVLSVGYIGSVGVHLIVPMDLNPIVPVNGAFSKLMGCKLVNGMYVTAGCKFVPFPRVNAAFGQLYLMEAQGHSSYNSLQVNFNRRLMKDIGAGVSYTYSHCIDNGSATYGQEGQNNGGNQNPYDLTADRSNCGFDIRHAMRANAVYYLPFHGNKLVEGWQASTIITATTGPWISPMTGFDQLALQNANAVRPNIVPGCGNLILGAADHWFNSACFTPAGPVSGPDGTLAGFLGNASRTSIPGPHLTSVDFSVMKDTKVAKISENFSVQFRAEFFNILNHYNFGLPNGNIFTQSGGQSAAEGQITSMVGTPRQIQFGLKLLF
jgi:hypothetical protein